MLQQPQVKDTASIAASTTNYWRIGNGQALSNTTEANLQITIRTAGTQSYPYVRVTANDRAQSTFAARVNAGSVNELITVTASGTGEFRDSVNTDAIAQDDEANFRLVTGSGGTAFVHRVFSTNFQATSGEMLLWMADGGAAVTVNNGTRYFCVSGELDGDTTTTQTEANVQYSSRVAGTWKSLQGNVRTNTRTLTSTARSRINAGNGNQLNTITAGTTGIVVDGSNTDSVASGDEINLSVTYPADGNNLRFWSQSSEWTSSTAAAPILAASDAPAPMTVNASVTTYGQFGGPNFSTTEADMAMDANVAQTFSFLSIYVLSTTLVGNTTVRVRKAAGNGNELLTIATAFTGYAEDGSNTDALALADEFDLQYVTPAVGTSIIFNNVAVVQTQTVAGGRIFKLAGEGGGLAGAMRGLAG